MFEILHGVGRHPDFRSGQIDCFPPQHGQNRFSNSLDQARMGYTGCADPTTWVRHGCGLILDRRSTPSLFLAPPLMLRLHLALIASLAAPLTSSIVDAQLTENQVLVLYNSQAPDANNSGQSDGKDIYDYYRQQYPGVVGFDLNDPTLLSGEISYAEFEAKIRNPLRSFLTTNNLQRNISVFTLTKGLPHRIYDINTPTLGDNPNSASAQLSAGNISYASVDAELALLYQNLSAGENNGRLDSHADNVVLNPYHNTAQSITDFSRTNVASPLFFEEVGGAAFLLHTSNGGPFADAGRLYLTSRLDGNSVDDVIGMIDRARVANYQQFDDRILFDETESGLLDGSSLFNNSLGQLGDDYDETVAQLATKYSNVTLEETGVFQIGANADNYLGTVEGQVVTDNIAVLASYGGNHGGNVTGFVESFEGQFVDGAILNTFESYNAKVFGDVTTGFSDQSQLSSYIEVGGTFGIGQTWEPFAFSLADNEVLLENFLFGGLTWVEAAWTSIPWISWQHVVVGDPLATATLIIDPQDAVWNGTDFIGTPGNGVSWSDRTNWTRNGFFDLSFRTGDRVIFAPGSTEFNVGIARDRIVESIQFQSDYHIQGAGRLVMRSGDITTDTNVVATISAAIMASRGLHKRGAGTLILNSSAETIQVHEGVLGGSGLANNMQVLDGGVFSPGDLDTAGQFTIVEDFQLNSAGILRLEVDGLSGTADSISVGGNASLDGNMEIVPVNQYQPPSSRGDFEAFQLITAGSTDGQLTVFFDGLELTPAFGLDDEGSFLAHLGDGLFQLVRYEPEGLELITYFALPGDANGDFIVDGADLAIWESNRFRSGTSWLTGDFNGDGNTDVRDFNIWNDNDGMLAGAAAVPEPATAVMLLLGWLCLLRSRIRQ